MAENAAPRVPYILGIDLGANSLGWTALRVGANGEPDGLLNSPEQMPERPSLGVRIFDEGVENYGQGEKEQSRAVSRRQARLQRRQTMRRARRMGKTFRILQGAGLLPLFDDDEVERCGSEELVRDSLLKKLDREIAARRSATESGDRTRAITERVPYALRAFALDRELNDFEVGRALYHLSQRRGFLSNRKETGREKKDETSKVKADIKSLAGEIERLGPGATLGKLLFASNPHEHRLRTRWTSRRMYQDEFAAIWDTQSRFKPDRLTDELRRRLHAAIFYQRPLKDQSGLIGTCELENGGRYVDTKTGEIRKVRRRKRAPECLLLSQRFRIAQTVTNLRVIVGHGEEASLSAKQRSDLIAILDQEAELPFSEMKKRLGLSRTTKVNLQDGGAKTLRGNRTNAQLVGIFRDRWRALGPAEQEAVVWEIWNAPDNDTMLERARLQRGGWRRLAPRASDVDALGEIVISSEYMSLSRAAMAKLLPKMAEGLAYTQAIQTVYGNRLAETECDTLPPVSDVLPEMRNPAVLRALTELRRVVNTLVRVFGKPDQIRIELARDLKRSKLDRKSMQKNIDENEKRRKFAAAAITEKTGRANPSRDDIERALLWEECGGICPYSGKSIGYSELFSGAVDIEHIIPFSRSLDDSYLNRTLCIAAVNRNEKCNRTPFEAFGHDTERWEAMLQRVRKNVMDKRMPEAKLERFGMTSDRLAEFLDDFTSKQLNDTRHASSKAREYLALLYGGNLSQGLDATGRRRVQVGNGQITALLRRMHGIDRALPTPRGEKRFDHRHHAVDAVAIALTSPSVVNKISRTSEENWQSRVRLLGPVSDPWSNFFDDIRAGLERINVSFRIDNRVRGALHAESIYSPRRAEQGARVESGPVTHIRKSVETLSMKDLDAIVDNRVREVLQRFFADREPAKVCVRGRNDTYPHLPNRNGPPVLVRHVRIRKSNTTRQVGQGSRAREVESSENHHLLVDIKRSSTGKSTAVYSLVPMFDAVRRRAEGASVIARMPDTACVLQKNDVVVLIENSTERSCRVLSISEKEFEGCWATDARKFEVRKQTGGRVRVSPAKFIFMNCGKISISPIGVVRPCRA